MSDIPSADWFLEFIRKALAAHDVEAVAAVLPVMAAYHPAEAQVVLNVLDLPASGDPS